MAENPKTDVEELFVPLGWFSLALFLVLGVIHLLARVDWFLLPRILGWGAIPLVIPGQLVVIAGLLSGKLPSGGDKRLSRDERWKVFWQGLRTVPWLWRIAAVVFFYGYVPWTAISLVIGNANLPRGNRAAVGWFPESNMEIVFVTLGGMAFALAHHLILRYALPRREEILSKVVQAGGTNTL
jgi:hypothetical protein